MRAYGAELTDVSSGGKGITERLIKGMIAKADEISRRPGHWFCDQLNNRDAESRYHALGDELGEQADGRVDAFVQAVASAHSIPAAAHASPNHNRPLHVVAVDPGA